MRRVLSIVFVLLYGLSPLTVAFAASDDAGLPACCRRHGAHHCAMTDAVRSSLVRAALRTPLFTAPAHCPSYPDGNSAAATSAHALTQSPSAPPVLLGRDALPPAYRADLRSRHLLACANRGPPVSLFS